MKTMKETEQKEFFEERKEIVKDFYQEKEFFEDLCASIESKLTPDFSKEDWFNLMEKSFVHQDTTSIEMLMSLWNSKVAPHLPPNLKPFGFGDDDA